MTPTVHAGLVALPFLLACTTLTAAPVIQDLTPEENATVPSLTTIKVTFDEPVTGIDPDDLVVNASAAAQVEGSGAGPYTFTFTQPLPGDVSVSWDFDHGIAGVSGSGAYQPEGGWNYQLIDTLPPEIGLARIGQSLESIVPLPDATVQSLSQVEVRFSELVTGVDPADLRMGPDGALVASSVTGEGAGPYIFTFDAEPEPGEVMFQWQAAAAIVDLAGNPFDTNHTWEVALSPGARGDIQITEFMAANATGLTDSDDDTSDWVELTNLGEETVDLAGWSLSADPDRPDLWVMASRKLGPGQRLIIFASGKDSNSPFGKPHTNFNLDLSDGGYLGLYGPESPRSVVSEFVDYPEQRFDFSYGVTPAGDLRYFSTPTPEEPNPESGLTEITPQPRVSVSRGFFAESFPLVMSSADPEAVIRYTLNGSEPLLTSPVYEGPLEIRETTILRAAAYASGKVASAAVTHSYIFLDPVLQQPEPPYDHPDREDDNENPALPTVGDATFPIAFGTQSGAGFPGEIDNLPNNTAPADYGMDSEIIDDPNRYNDDGEIDPENGFTNTERIERSLRSMPLLSLVMDNDDMFGEDGLHPNSRQKGTQFEFPCSIELLLPDGTTGFDTTCGIRMHGNASREPRKCPKHGFKLNFKSSFGASRLNYPLFPDSPSTEFDDIILRGDFNSSWLHWDGGQQRPRGTRMRDAFCKDTFRDMGRAAGHARYVHLFINGVYWGLYDATEQENNGFAANTFGGDKDDYDVVEQGALKSGSRTAYDKMRNLPRPTTNELYEEMKQYLDVDWYIDYMLLHFYLGHQDWGDNVDKNWYTVRHQDGQFRYLPWDMENLMWDEDVNRVTVSNPPTGLHPKLMANDQYLLDFADRVHKHLVAPDGALRPEKAIARWKQWRAVVQDAIVCESARWGDYRRDVHRHQSGPYPLFTWNESWITEQNRLTETWFPKRPDIVLKQLRDDGLYPTTQAPQFKDASRQLVGSQRVSPGFELSITKASVFAGGTLYYTTDGTDPRVYFDTTGEVSPTAQAVAGTITIDRTTVVKARALDRGRWSALMEATFTIDSPKPGVRISELHYNAKGSLGGSAAEFVELHNVSDTAVDIGKWSFDGIEFVFPWGTVVGPGDRVVVASNDAPSIFHAQHPGVTVVGYYRGSVSNGGERISLFDGRGNLVSSVEYSDDAPWPVTPDNEGPSLEVADARGDLQSPFNWRSSLTLNGTPGLPNSSAQSLPDVIVSGFLAQDTVDGSYAQLINTTGAPISLGGWQLIGEETVTLPADRMLEPGVILTVPLALDEDWGLIALLDAEGRTVDGVRFGKQAKGFALTRSLENLQWQLSAPEGQGNGAPVETGDLTDLRLNEWQANPTPGFDDWLEIMNTNTEQPVLLTGLHVGAGTELFVMHAPSVIGPGEWARFACDRGARRADAFLFQLPSEGTTVTLGDAAGDVFDHVSYASQAEGISSGRLPDGSGEVTPLDYPSPGRPNAVAMDGHLQLSEVFIGTDGWIEWQALADVTLDGWRLRSVSHAPETWGFPADASLAAGEFGSIDVAGSLPLDPSYAHWGVELLNPKGQMVDRITWGLQLSAHSIGRLADGAWNVLAEPSRGTENGAALALGNTASLRINEWFAAGGESEIDRSFLELYNGAAEPVALGGLWLSDEPSEAGRQKWRVPALSFVSAHGHALFESGNGSSRPSRFNFDIARSGEYLRLGAGETAEAALDAIGFQQQVSLTESFGRLPDGAESLAILVPTPGSTNANELPERLRFADWAAVHGVSDPNADDDGDGLINMIEFLSGLDPTVPASAAERAATRENVQLHEANGQRWIRISLSLAEDAGYEAIVGERSRALQAPWSEVAPNRMEILEETELGTQRIQFEFAVPDNEPAHFLRLRITP